MAKSEGTIARFKKRSAKKKITKAKRALREARAGGVVQKANEAWSELTRLIADYAQAYTDESWKGGGDPAEFEVLEARLVLARCELNSHMEKMRREYEP